MKKSRKSRKVVTDLSCEEILSTIGQQIKYDGRYEEISAIYFYVNKYGVCSIRIRLKGIWSFVNVKSLTKINNKIVFEF